MVTYMQLCNNVLAELNEVLLTEASFPSAVNIQLHVKKAVNKAYLDLNNPEYKWPWLSVASPLDEYLGNTYVETQPGTRWYNLNPSRTDQNSDFGHVDWENFTLTEEGVAGKEAPYEVRELQYMELDTWRRFYARSESLDKSDSRTYGVPRRVLRSPDGFKFGLSPIPDEVYRVYLYAWNRPVTLSAFDDPIALPDQFQNVLESRARYYAWQRKENPQQAALALQEYEDGLKAMRAQTIDEGPDDFTDDRLFYV